MTSAESPSPADRTVAQRARLRTIRERRRRFRRRMVAFVVVVVVMILVALANRDTQQLRASRKQAAVVAAALQEAYTRPQDPPLRFPDLPEPYAKLHEQYYFNMFYANQKEWSREVGVCCLKRPARFFLRADGRVVVLFDGEEFLPEWMTESDFRARADELGFGSLLKD